MAYWIASIKLKARLSSICSNENEMGKMRIAKLR